MSNGKNKRIRLFVQIFFFTLIGLIAINKTLAETGMGIPFLSQASLHTLCPYGGVVSVYNLVTAGTFVQKIHSSALILMGIVFFLAILFGPVFCGWVCPLGSIQEWIGKAGRKLFKNRYNHLVPVKLDRIMGYFRYVVLIMSVYVTARSGLLLFEKVDPYYALFKFWSEEVAVSALIVLGVTLVLSLLVERPWCKYACPYGALLGLTNKISIFKIKRSSATCIDCGKCDRSCPMNIEVSKKGAVTDSSCIRCYGCTSENNCPVPDTVTMKAGRNSDEN